MLFATKINVVFENKRMNEQQSFGESDYSRSQITLSTTNGLDALSEDKILDTFYHEKVHMILDTLGYRAESKNELFVDTFAKAFRQTIESAEYESVKNKKK